MKYKHDTHIHIDLLENSPNVISQIENNKIYTIAVTNLPPLYEKLKKELNSKYIRVALGFHPDLLNQYKKYIPDMWKNLNQTKYIGEVGLDSKNKSKIEFHNQIFFFEELINRCNALGNKIISIHSRGAVKEIMAILRNGFNGKIILHWYLGINRYLDESIELGFYFSINKAMLQSNNGKNIISKIPLDRLLIESDAPFVSHNNYPYDLQLTINKLSQLKKVDVNEMESILSNNFEKILRE